MHTTSLIFNYFGNFEGKIYRVLSWILNVIFVSHFINKFFISSCLWKKILHFQDWLDHHWDLGLVHGRLLGWGSPKLIAPLPQTQKSKFTFLNVDYIYIYINIYTGISLFIRDSCLVFSRRRLWELYFVDLWTVLNGRARNLNQNGVYSHNNYI